MLHNFSVVRHDKQEALAVDNMPVEHVELVLLIGQRGLLYCYAKERAVCISILHKMGVLMHDCGCVFEMGDMVMMHMPPL